MYGSETMLWKENEISRIRAVQMNNLRGWIELCRVKKGLEERTDEGMLQWFNHGESDRMPRESM